MGGNPRSIRGAAMLRWGHRRPANSRGRYANPPTLCSMKRRQRGKTEPLRCICRPGKDAHPQHGRPGRHVAQHFDPQCPHWDPASSGLPIGRVQSQPTTKPLKRVQLDE